MRCPALEELPPPLPDKTGWPWTVASKPLPERMPDGRGWPKISIVTPSYNQGEFIEETIRSVLLQGYPNLEYIIIDGGSTDQSVEIIKKYEKWLAYWMSQKDNGQADAINKGFAWATGEIFAYLNSDDVYMSSIFSKVAEIYETTEDKGSFWAAFPVVNFAEGHEETVQQDKQMDFVWWITGRASLHQPGVFWSANLLNKVKGFDESYNYAFDRKFFIQLVAMNLKPCVYEDTVAARFRVHNESKTYLHDIIGDGFKSEFKRLSSEMLEAASLRQRYAYRRYARQNYMSSQLMKSAVAGKQGQWLEQAKSILYRYPDAIATRFFWGWIIRQIAHTNKVAR